MSQTNVDLARRGFEAAQRGDYDAVADFLDPDVSWHGGDPSDAGACHNRSQALTFMQRALASRRLGELVDVIDAGEQVVVLLRAPREDGEVGAVSANLTTFRDGKAIEMVHYADPRDALAAAGLPPR